MSSASTSAAAPATTAVKAIYLVPDLTEMIGRVHRAGGGVGVVDELSNMRLPGFADPQGERRLRVWLGMPAEERERLTPTKLRAFYKEGSSGRTLAIADPGKLREFCQQVLFDQSGRNNVAQGTLQQGMQATLLASDKPQGPWEVRLAEPFPFLLDRTTQRLPYGQSQALAVELTAPCRGIGTRFSKVRELTPDISHAHHVCASAGIAIFPDPICNSTAVTMLVKDKRFEQNPRHPFWEVRVATTADGENAYLCTNCTAANTALKAGDGGRCWAHYLVDRLMTAQGSRRRGLITASMELYKITNPDEYSTRDQEG